MYNLSGSNSWCMAICKDITTQNLMSYEFYNFCPRNSTWTYFWAHLCLCTVGSYTSLCICLSVCLSVTRPKLRLDNGVLNIGSILVVSLFGCKILCSFMPLDVLKPPKNVGYLQKCEHKHPTILRANPSITSSCIFLVKSSMVDDFFVCEQLRSCFSMAWFMYISVEVTADVWPEWVHRQIWLCCQVQSCYKLTFRWGNSISCFRPFLSHKCYIMEIPYKYHGHYILDM